MNANSVNNLHGIIVYLEICEELFPILIEHFMLNSLAEMGLV